MGVNSFCHGDELYCQLGRELRESDTSAMASQGSDLSTRLIEVVSSLQCRKQRRRTVLNFDFFSYVYLLTLGRREQGPEFSFGHVSYSSRQVRQASEYINLKVKREFRARIKFEFMDHMYPKSLK